MPKAEEAARSRYTKGDCVKYSVPVNGEWMTFDDKQLTLLRSSGDSGVNTAAFLERRVIEKERNGLAYMLPHGVAWHKNKKTYANGRIVLEPSKYPESWKNDGVAFLNDWSNDFVLLVAPRKTGKSYLGATKIGLMACECQPDWPIFTEHNIIYREWTGPKTIAISSFSWKNVAELWEVYREILPRHELRNFSPRWGKFDGEEGKQRNLSFRSGQQQEITLAYSGTRLIFLCYTQAQAAWENFKADALHADEQAPLGKLQAYQDGTRTMGDYTPAIFTLSGFTLPERPEDTGSIGPIKRTIWDARKGDPRKIGRYNFDIASTPDCIISPKKKQLAYDQYVNPKIKREKKIERRALACYYPGWEPPSEAAFDPDVWDREIHVIDRLWPDDKTPSSFTKWRSIDYCDKKTTCCGWFAVANWGVICKECGIRVNKGVDLTSDVAILYRSLYEQNVLVATGVKQIIAMSHNQTSISGVERDDETGNVYQQFVEIQNREEFYTDLLDSRYAERREQGQTIQELFERYGMENIQKASGSNNEVQIPILKDWLRIDWGKPHPFKRNEDGTPFMGCTSLFFFDGAADEIIEELETIPSDNQVRKITSSVIDMKFPHDGIDMMKYWASDQPCYMGDELTSNDNIYANDDDEGCATSNYSF